MSELFSSQEQIVLFGASKIGLCAKRAVERLGGTVVCFCDNDPQKQGELLAGLRVLSPQEVKATFPTPHVFLCFIHNNPIRAVREQLFAQGFTRVSEGGELLYIYHTQVMERPKTSRYREAFLASDAGVTDIPHALVIATNRCTLACKDCGHMTTHYATPQHYPRAQVVESIRRLAACAGKINLLSIVGGEPLMHPELAGICEDIASIENIKMIRIVTNATLVPDETLMAAISRCITFLTISNYGKLSRQMQPLQAALAARGIAFDVNPEATSWYPVGFPLETARNVAQTQALFDACSWGRGCMAVQNGMLHLCNYSSTTQALGLHTPNQGDFVELLLPGMSTEALTEQVTALRTRRTPASVCARCNFDFTKEVDPARQKKGAE